MNFVAVDGMTFNVRSVGSSDAPPLVLVNSLGTDARLWDAMLGELAGACRVITYDKRGHGLSSAPPAPYRIDDHVDDLAALADALGLARFALAGVSVGGMIAMGFAARQPGRIGALVLCDTAVRIGTEDSWNERIDAVSRGGIAALADAILERWFTRRFRAERPVELAGWRHMLERTPAAGYIGTCAALRDADLATAAAGIGLPTLVVAGEEDGSTPPALVAATAALLPQGRFEVIPDAAHLPMVEQPERLGRLFSSYFSEVGYV